MVKSLSKSITHTNLILLPKKDHSNIFVDLRPISLSNFINKIIYRVLPDRVEGLLPKLILSNQSGFVKGRCVIENVFLLVAYIRKTGKPSNVIF